MRSRLKVTAVVAAGVLAAGTLGLAWRSELWTQIRSIRSYAATDDMVAVQGGWPDPPRALSRLAEAQKLVEDHPVHYAGAWVEPHDKMCGGPVVVLGVPIGGAQQGVQQLDGSAVVTGCDTGLVLQEGRWPTYARLVQIMGEFSGPGMDDSVVEAAIDESRHVVVFSTTSLSHDLRRRMKSRYGDDVVLDLITDTPGIR